jgi:hypothetical protein
MKISFKALEDVCTPFDKPIFCQHRNSGPGFDIHPLVIQKAFRESENISGLNIFYAGFVEKIT